MEVELNKQFAQKIGSMIESRLIWYKHYFLFCDEVIDKMDKPPYWIIELATTKFIGDAVRIVNRYAYSPPFEMFPDSVYDFYLGCLFLRYERRELSWASFLNDSGNYADAYQAVKHDCEFFYYMLNDYEDSEYSFELEKKQAGMIKEEFKNEIHEARDLYVPFLDYFRRYVSS